MYFEQSKIAFVLIIVREFVLVIVLVLLIICFRIHDGFVNAVGFLFEQIVSLDRQFAAHRKL